MRQLAILILFVACGFHAQSLSAAPVTEQDFVGHAYCTGIKPESPFGGFRRFKLYLGGKAILEFHSEDGTLKYAVVNIWQFDSNLQMFRATSGSSALAVAQMGQIRASPDRNYLVLGPANIWHRCDDDENVHPTDPNLTAGSVLEPNLNMQPATANSPQFKNSYWCSTTDAGVYTRRRFRDDGQLEVTRFPSSSRVAMGAPIYVSWSITTPGLLDEIGSDGNPYRLRISVNPSGSVLYFKGIRHIRCDQGPVEQQPDNS